MRILSRRHRASHRWNNLQSTRFPDGGWETISAARSGIPQSQIAENLGRTGYDKRASRQDVETKSHLVELNPDMPAASGRTISRPLNVIWVAGRPLPLLVPLVLRARTSAESYTLHETSG